MNKFYTVAHRGHAANKNNDANKELNYSKTEWLQTIIMLPQTKVILLQTKLMLRQIKTMWLQNK